jgi:7-cyano-7-deazaguanine synthase
MGTIALVSGGLDSAVMLKQIDGPIHGLFVDYGQPAVNAELEAAYAVTKWAGVPLATFSMPLECDQLLGSDACIVPGRNLALISAAVNVTGHISADTVAIGAAAADVAYPDCSAAFISQASVCLSHYGMRLIAPLLEWDRDRVVAEAIGLGLDPDITWSCYRPGADPCGVCTSCKQGV